MPSQVTATVRAAVLRNWRCRWSTRSTVSIWLMTGLHASVHRRTCVRRRARQAPPRVSRRLTQRAERGSDLGAENRRLLPCREVAALVGLVEIDELVIGLLRPAARRLIAFARKTVTAAGMEMLAAL